MTKLIFVLRNIANTLQNWPVEMCVCMCVCVLYICVIVIITDKRLNYLRAAGFKKTPDEELGFCANLIINVKFYGAFSEGCVMMSGEFNVRN